MEGWIKLYRKILNDPLMNDRKDKNNAYLLTWIYLLLNATHKEIKKNFKGKETILQPGELIVTRNEIAERFQIDASKIYRVLNRLESEQLIEQQKSSANTLISIKNWNKYQFTEQLNDNIVNEVCTTSEQPINNKNEINNINNNNIYYNSDENFEKEESEEYQKQKEDYFNFIKELEKRNLGGR